MFEYTQFESATLNQRPFRWVHLAEAFPADVANQLSDSFPMEGMRESVGHDGHYHLWDRTLISEGEIVQNGAGLGPSWRGLVEHLVTEEYRGGIERLMKVSLDESRLLVRACRYSAGMWMLPHTDRADRVVTQIVYLNPRWEGAWGGELRILREPDEEAVEHTVLPLFNTSVVFARSDRSFHSVRKVEEFVTEPRLSLLLQFVKSEE